MILIDALFINKGGGAVLLEYLIEKILAHKRKDDFFFVLDPRFERPAILDKNYAIVNNQLKNRIQFYKQNKDKFSKVFCFANIPPPIKLDVPVYTYFQNQKLLEAPGRKFSKEYFRTYLKYLVIRLFNKNTDYYIVQTPHMMRELRVIGLKKMSLCLMISFYDDRKYHEAKIPFVDRVQDEFVFISNPSPQKNYPVLLDAWECLLQQGYTPKLHVTVDNTAPHLLVRIADLNAQGARIENHVLRGSEGPILQLSLSYFPLAGGKLRPAPDRGYGERHEGAGI